MTNMLDFNEAETQTIRDFVNNRWKKATIELHPADIETKLSAYSEEMTECPAIFWNHEDCSFIVIKTGENQYRCQFFYSPHEQYGTGINEYNDLEKCVTSLLQVQADHDSIRSGSFPDQPSPAN